MIYEILNSGSVSSFIYKYTTPFALVDTFKPYSSGLNLRRTTLLQSTGDYLVKNNKTTALFSGIFIYIFLIKEKKMSRTFVDLPVHGLINQSLCLNSNYLFNKKILGIILIQRSKLLDYDDLSPKVPSSQMHPSLYNVCYHILDMTLVAVLPLEAGDGLEEHDSYFK